jgi:hypothetical protein
MAKYVVPGVPGGAAPSAFMPHWNKYAASGAQQYKQNLTGQPGTQAIPAPTKDTVPSPDLGDIAQMGLSRSSDAPGVFYPQEYYLDRLTAGYPGAMAPKGPDIRIYSDNLMPVPAVDPRGIPARLARPVNQRGRKQIRQTRPQPEWNQF